ncbi:MAG: hypothetical protein H7256_08185 [Bdellovibrio sp.]|nr:hypothetical protein [Bdellovibrio sp.]
MSLKSSFIEHLLHKYPQLSAQQLDGYVSDQLVSPFQISLPKSNIENIQLQIKMYWKLRFWTEQHLSAQYDALGLTKPKNYSACMSYDFHVNANNGLELIEINTNASFLALGLELYAFWKIKNAAGDFGEKELVDMFLEEIKLSGSTKNLNSIAIIDENPEQQRLYLEFLVYKMMFEKRNIKTEISSFDQIEKLKEHSLVYNRYTDFYLEEPKSNTLKDAFNNGDVHLSPHPYEYFLLADKQRLIDWNNQTEVEKPSSLIPVYDMGKESAEKMWAERKSLFFKPKTSFGSKQAYRGSSISKKAFEEVCNSGFIAQQISTPSELDFVLNNEPIKLKYDLRCYAYKDELQLIVARLYQGQTTNLRTAGGGFACVRVVD